jgi:hypothetical protein
MNPLTPVEIAMALSLYAYNVSPQQRAAELYHHFRGACMEMDELTYILTHRGPYAATELPYPTAKVYVEHALARYGKQAVERARIEAEGYRALEGKQ